MKPLLHTILLMALASTAWAGMGVDDARHLLLRTGMGVTPAEVDSLARLDRQAAVDRLLAGARRQPSTTPPAELMVYTPHVRPQPSEPGNSEASEAQRRALLREQMQKGVALRAWWFEEMLSTPSPLTEKMTLFWHNHFVSGIQKVKQGKFMLDQNLLLREHSLGNFGAMLHAVARDPAMVIYLDSAQNRRNAPNENFARELMELFTLGEGHYSEQDIKETARAFTGWSLDRDTGTFRFYPRMHDAGDKTILGKSGDLDGDQVLDILLAQAATAELLSRKLWREFVSPEPEPAEIRRLAAVLRDAKYDIKPWLRALLLSPAFWDARNRGVLVKSPVEFLLGAIKNFQVSGADGRLLGMASRQLGQDLFNPPNVKGWPGGEQWLDASSLLARKQIAERLFRAQPAQPRAEQIPRREQMQEIGWQQMVPDTHQLLDLLGSDDAARRRNFQQRILATASINPIPPSLSLSAYLLALMQDPVYQLK